jgi:hypothetical protein
MPFQHTLESVEKYIKEKNVGKLLKLDFKGHNAMSFLAEKTYLRDKFNFSPPSGERPLDECVFSVLRICQEHLYELLNLPLNVNIKGHYPLHMFIISDSVSFSYIMSSFRYMKEEEKVKILRVETEIIKCSALDLAARFMPKFVDRILR